MYIKVRCVKFTVNESEHCKLPSARQLLDFLVKEIIKISIFVIIYVTKGRIYFILATLHFDSIYFGNWQRSKIFYVLVFLKCIACYCSLNYNNEIKMKSINSDHIIFKKRRKR